MKKILKLFMCTIVVSIFMFSNVNIFANMEDENSSFDFSQNKLRIMVNRGAFTKDYWAEFEFVNKGNNVSELEHVYNGIIYQPDEINENINIVGPITIRFIDNEGNKYFDMHFNEKTKLKNFVKYVSSVPIRYGLDSIQVIPFGNSGSYKAAITGPINANHSNIDISTVLRENTGNEYIFRVEKEGLYAHYISQVRINNENISYTIRPNSIENEKVIFRRNKNFFPNDNTLGVNFINSVGPDLHSRWEFIWDNINKAYRIKCQIPGYEEYLTWNSSIGNKVMTYEKSPYPDQLWHVEKHYTGQEGRIYIRSAYNKNMFLTIDGNEVNVAPKTSKSIIGIKN